MKAIFTGTEQDLIDAEFEKFDYDYSIKQKLNPPEYAKVVMKYVCENYIYVIQIQNNIIKQLKCYRTYTEEMDNVNKGYIQDLIDKNLVRWE